jgi:hypothetical protein
MAEEDLWLFDGNAGSSIEIYPQCSNVLGGLAVGESGTGLQSAPCLVAQYINCLGMRLDWFWVLREDPFRSRRAIAQSADRLATREAPGHNRRPYDIQADLPPVVPRS